MSKFKPHINPVYPPNNNLIFEEWFDQNYSKCDTDRELLPVYFTSYWVNNNYGNDKEARRELNDFLGTLDKSKKYFSIIQYDDGSMIDWRLFGLDVLEFNMSKQNGVMIPLICQPHSIRYDEKKKYIASFIGSVTHPIRTEMIESLRGKDGYYISTEPHSYDDYNKIISQSMFCLSPRGYGAASFRCYCEAVYQGSIPIYISDEHIIPFGLDFEQFGVIVNRVDIKKLDDIIMNIEPIEILNKQSRLDYHYKNYFSYEGCFNQIIKSLEAEYHSRQQG